MECVTEGWRDRHCNNASIFVIARSSTAFDVFVSSPHSSLPFNICKGQFLYMTPGLLSLWGAATTWQSHSAWRKLRGIASCLAMTPGLLSLRGATATWQSHSAWRKLRGITNYILVICPSGRTLCVQFWSNKISASLQSQWHQGCCRCEERQ